MPSVNFVTVDVFTKTRFAGNPLAVIPDARGLSSSQMQSIATEFNYSETTFVLPPSDPADHSAQVRIFTPTVEVPFAGHPNVGTAFVLGQHPALFDKPIVADSLRFEEKAGTVDVTLVRDEGTGAVTGATILAPGSLNVFRDPATLTPELIARCASLPSPTTQIRTAVHLPVIASVGLAFAIAELESLSDLAAASPNVAEFRSAAASVLGEHASAFPLFLYVRDDADPWRIRARMFAPLDNVPEDPATGSASAALGAFLVSMVPLRDTVVRATVEQGVEMGRPSVIELEVVKVEGEVRDVFVTGPCVEVMRGSLTV